LSASDNQTLYFIANNTSSSNQTGLFSVKIANPASQSQVSLIRQLPAATTPSFAYVDPGYLAFRTSNGTGTQIHHYKMNSTEFVDVRVDATPFGLLSASEVIGPFSSCSLSTFNWIFAGSGQGSSFIL
jgi:hypothetical protein